MPVLERLIVMPGPNLSSDLPGVKLTAKWPAQMLQRQEYVAEGARKALQPFFPSLADRAEFPAGKPVLDQLVGEIAFSLMASLSDKMAQPPRPSGNDIPGPEIVLHHRDIATAAFAGHAAVKLTGMAAREQLEVTAAPSFAERFEPAVTEFRNQWKGMAFGESSWRKIAEAERRNIPWRRLIVNERILQFGHGSRQVRARDSLSEVDSHLATLIASNKILASEVLRSSGLPVPRSFATVDLTSARRAARELGFPVVVKPATTDYGIAVAVNLQSDQDVVAAFEPARRHGVVVIEKFVPGMHYRLLVMHGDFLGAVRQDPAHVIGDGLHRIDQLVQLANHGRSDQLSADLKRIAVDKEVVGVLDRQGMNLASVPSQGRRVLLREHSNLSVGGTYENVTDQVHPDNRLLAERAAKAVGLKVAGIDFITTDISRSHLETGGMICEINASPGFVMGQPGYQVEAAYFDGLFPDGGDGRIPIIAVLSERSVPELLAQIESTAQSHGHRPVIATAAFVRRPGQTLAAGSFSQFFSVCAALQDPDATAVIVQLSPSATIEEGLIFDRCDLGIVDESAVAAGAAACELLARHSRLYMHGDDRQSVQAALHNVLGR